MRALGLAYIALVVAACGSSDSIDISNDPVVDTSPNPTTTLVVLPSTTEPPPLVLDANEQSVLGNWQFESLDPSDRFDTQNIDAGYLRVEALPAFGVVASVIRAGSPTADFVCGPDGSFAGGTISIDNDMLTVVEAFEQPAVECPDSIPVVPLLNPVAACLTSGCPYRVDDDVLTLEITDGAVLNLRLVEPRD